jgi:hypothetical protein
LPPSIFGFQLLKIQRYISRSGADPSFLVDHRMCGKDGKINFCDVGVKRGSHLQTVDESFHRPDSLASQVCLQLSLYKVFAMFLLPIRGQSSALESYGLWFWQYGMLFPCLWFV